MNFQAGVEVVAGLAGVAAAGLAEVAAVGLAVAAGFWTVFGEVISGKDFLVRGQDGSKLVNLTIGEMKEAWKKPLQW